MIKSALLIAAGGAALISSPADARYRHHRHHYRHHVYYRYSYYSPYRYYRYSYPAYAYSYPVYYSYPMYYPYPAYSYPTFGVSIGLGGYRYRRW